MAQHNGSLHSSIYAWVYWVLVAMHIHSYLSQSCKTNHWGNYQDQHHIIIWPTGSSIHKLSTNWCIMKLSRMTGMFLVCVLKSNTVLFSVYIHVDDLNAFLCKPKSNFHLFRTTHATFWCLSLLDWWHPFKPDMSWLVHVHLPASIYIYIYIYIYNTVIGPHLGGNLDSLNIATYHQEYNVAF